jgi:pyruvate dehydrogenase E2 component (dihydrolipoamide acetyltransferase)
MEDGRIKASPLARNIAREKGIDLAQVQGTGPDGRIVRADVESFTPAAPATPAASAAPAAGVRPTWGRLPEGDDVEIIDITKMRRAIADSTITSKSQVPHFYVTVDIDVEALLALRTQLNAGLEAEGVKISVNDLVVKAAALTLKKFPNLNTHFYGDRLVRHKRINIGIAVALPNNGLLNVVSPDADRTALSAMAKHHKEMFDRAREGKVRPEDLRGATFTVSNLGPYDVEQFAAIISPPEAGILAVSSARRVPIVKPDGTIGVGNRMKVTISVDHRVSDGAEGAQFMQYFRSLIENPMKLLV